MRILVRVAARVVNWFPSLRRQIMPAQLSDATQQKLQAALTAKDTADAATAQNATDKAALATAQAAVDASTADALAKHQAALAADHDFIAAAAADLGFTLPDGF